MPPHVHRQKPGLAGAPVRLHLAGVDHGIEEADATVLLHELAAALGTPIPAPARTIDTLSRRLEVLAQVIAALQGRRDPLTWGEGERMTRTRMLRDLGIELVSETGARKRGLEVRPRARPVASAYFGAPLQVWADLFVLHVQTRPRRSK